MKHRAMLLAALGSAFGSALAGCGSPAPSAPKIADPATPPPAPVLWDRAALFASPAVSDAQISPDGARLAWRDAQGGLRVSAVDAPSSGADAPADAARVVRFAWAQTSAHLIAIEAALDGGNENARSASVRDVATGARLALTQEGETVFSDMIAMSASQADRVVLMVRPRGADRAQLMSFDLVTGAREVLDRNRQGFSEFHLDGRNRPVVARLSHPEGDSLWRRVDERRWEKFADIPPTDVVSTRVLGVSPDGRMMTMVDSVGRPRAALLSVALESGERTVVGESRQADVSDVWIDPPTGAPQAFASEYLRPSWTPLTPNAQADLRTLDDALEGEFRIASRTRDDSVWLVAEESPVTPMRYALYDRRTRAVRPALRDLTPPTQPFAPLLPVEIPARDGQQLVSYLTLPIGADTDRDGVPSTPAPLALIVHDGPWGRDAYRFRVDHQFLANRGYAVLSVNYRGSVGLGSAFQALGERGVASAVEADLQDAASWAITRGIAAAGRIGVFGEGLGGTIALNLLADPERRFACAAAADAPTTVVPNAAMAARLRVGSPVERAASMSGAVLLMAHQAWRAPAEAFANALRAAGKTYALAAIAPSSAGAGVRPDPVRVYGLLETFFQSCLGGLAQPFGPDPAVTMRWGGAVIPGFLPDGATGGGAGGAVGGPTRIRR